MCVLHFPCLDMEDHKVNTTQNTYSRTFLRHSEVLASELCLLLLVLPTVILRATLKMRTSHPQVCVCPENSGYYLGDGWALMLK